MASELVIVFENPPGAKPARFVEVEDVDSGESVEIPWRQWSNNPESWMLGSFARYEDVVDLEAENERLRTVLSAVDRRLKRGLDSGDELDVHVREALIRLSLILEPEQWTPA